jgi:transposase
MSGVVRRRTGEGTGGKGCERHLAGDPPAILGRRKDSHRAGGLRGEESIAELCRREGIVQNLYYRWSKAVLEAGKKRLAGDTARAATSDEVKDLRREASVLKEVLAELTRCDYGGALSSTFIFISFPRRVDGGGKNPRQRH